jgi:hypothetical protein
MDRLAEIKNQGHASKVLIVSALVTTRHVRFFKNRHYDHNKLKTILNAMQSTQGEKELSDKGITLTEKDKKIYILTEAVMGGSFSGIVTYLKKETSKGDAKHQAKHSSFSSSTEANVIGIEASYNHAQQKANESHNNSIENRSNLNVTIEFIAQGAVPQLTREKVVREMMKYQDQNLRNYESSNSEKSDQSVQIRQAELQQSMYTTLNTLPKTSLQQEEISIHSPQSVLKAYDDFCQQIVEDSACGVPIGFNYAELTEKTIQELVKPSTQTDQV